MKYRLNANETNDQWVRLLVIRFTTHLTFSIAGCIINQINHFFLDFLFFEIKRTGILSRIYFSVLLV